MNTRLSDHDLLQVEMAARGCISGQLREWPDLQTALRRAGYSLADSTHAYQIKTICRRLFEEHVKVSPGQL